MATTVLLIADTPDRTQVQQPGQPPSQMAAWILDVATGTDPLQAANTWASTQGFQTGTTMRVIVNPQAIQTFTLQSQWVAQ